MSLPRARHLGRARPVGADPERRARSSCGGRRCSRATGGTRRRPRQPSPVAGSTPATSALRDEDGYLFIVDRLKDMIVSGGENIARSEVERVLYEHEAVLEAAVVGRPDERWGEIPVAFVVRREGASATADELIESLPRPVGALQGPQGDHLPRCPAPQSVRQGAQAGTSGPLRTRSLDRRSFPPTEPRRALVDPPVAVPAPEPPGRRAGLVPRPGPRRPLPTWRSGVGSSPHSWSTSARRTGSIQRPARIDAVLAQRGRAPGPRHRRRELRGPRVPGASSEGHVEMRHHWVAPVPQ